MLSMYEEAEKRYGLPSGYLARTAQIESGGNPNAKNPNSSAGGLFQFIDSTANQYGLKNKFDPAAATDAAARLARDNQSFLSKRLGRAPTAAELYLAHQQGPGGAVKLLRNPNAAAASATGNAAIALNAGKQGQTSGEFANQWLNKFNNVKAPANGPTIAAAQQLPHQQAPATVPILAQNVDPSAFPKTPALEGSGLVGLAKSGDFSGANVKSALGGQAGAGLQSGLGFLAQAMGGGAEQAAVPAAPPPEANQPVDMAAFQQMLMPRRKRMMQNALAG